MVFIIFIVFVSIITWVIIPYLLSITFKKISISLYYSFLIPNLATPFIFIIIRVLPSNEARSSFAKFIPLYFFLIIISGYIYGRIKMIKKNSPQK